VKSAVVLTLLVVLQAGGNLCLSRGMHAVGRLEADARAALSELVWQLLASPWIALATALLLAHFLLYLAALARLDLSYVLPMTASSYVLTAWLAWLLLGEAISAIRWAGTLVVAGGVFLVGYGERQLDTASGMRPTTYRADDGREAAP
jgi:drug/metabolite transporter (DMT)-like permease